MGAVAGPDGNPEERINRLIRDYRPELLRLCFAYLKDVSLAEDAVQETFIRAYKGVRAFRVESEERTWLYRIEVNACKDMRRSAWFHMMRREVSLSKLQIPSGQPEPTSSALAAGMTFSDRFDAKRLAMDALEGKYGITQERITLFRIHVEERGEDGPL